MLSFRGTCSRCVIAKLATSINRSALSCTFLDVQSNTTYLMPPVGLLFTAFCIWKTVLLFLVWCAPGRGYDTSTTLLNSNSKLLRWDAIYYVHTARHGHVFEQEWAFGTGLSTLLGWSSQHELDVTVTAGVMIALCSHFLSVVLVWAIADCLSVRNAQASQKRSLPFVAACLHIISPAGVFLCAPYSESPFSCLNMFGYWLYVQARFTSQENHLIWKCALLVASGISLGCATVVRNNGILSGFPLLFNAIGLTWKIMRSLQHKVILWAGVYQLVATVLAGVCILVGLLLPQYWAYSEYCATNEMIRPWCSQRLPLIFSFVQSHYW